MGEIKYFFFILLLVTKGGLNQKNLDIPLLLASLKKNHALKDSK